MRACVCVRARAQGETHGGQRVTVVRTQIFAHILHMGNVCRGVCNREMAPRCTGTRTAGARGRMQRGRGWCRGVGDCAGCAEARRVPKVGGRPASGERAVGCGAALASGAARPGTRRVCRPVIVSQAAPAPPRPPPPAPDCLRKSAISAVRSGRTYWQDGWVVSYLRARLGFETVRKRNGCACHLTLAPRKTQATNHKKKCFPDWAEYHSAPCGA